MKKTFLGLVLASFGLIILTPACSASDTTAANDANVVNVDVGGPNGNRFSPASVTIKVGQTVRWTWKGGTHNVVSGPDCATEDGKIKSGAPAPGGSFDKKFDVAGTYAYYCQPHCDMGMKGEVVVE